MYYVNDVIYSERSPKNQKIMSLFIQREIKQDVTSLVNYVFDTATEQNAPPFSMADLDCVSPLCCQYCGGENVDEVIVEPSMVTADYLPEGDPGEQYGCPLCGMTYATPEEAQQCCAGQIAYLCADCGGLMSQETMDEMQEEEHDLSDAQWYLVSDWLGEKLQSYGEVVIRTDEYALWGRTFTHKPLVEESVLQKICSALQILDGQPHCWPVK